MDTHKHTAEPWEIDSGIGRHVVIGRSLTGRPFVIADCEAAYAPVGEANAARAVACVNACAPDGRLTTLLRRLVSKAIDSGATASERVDAHDAAEILHALGS